MPVPDRLRRPGRKPSYARSRASRCPTGLARVTTVLVDFPPHAYTPAHRHPGSVQAYVLHGMLRSQLAGGAAITYRAGETWFEPAGVVHRFAENPAAEPAQLLALFVTDEDCGPLVVMEPLQ